MNRVVQKESNENKMAEIFGWYGVVAILCGFGLNNFDILTTQDIGYQLLNLSGALGIITSSYVKKDFQPVALNIMWMAIALIALVRLM